MGASQGILIATYPYKLWKYHDVVDACTSPQLTFVMHLGYLLSHAGLIDWVVVPSRPPYCKHGQAVYTFDPGHIYFLLSIAAQPVESRLPVIWNFLFLCSQLPSHSFLIVYANARRAKASCLNRTARSKTTYWRWKGTFLLFIVYGLPVESTYPRVELYCRCVYTLNENSVVSSLHRFFWSWWLVSVMVWLPDQ